MDCHNGKIYGKDNLKIFYMEGKCLELNYNDGSFFKASICGLICAETTIGDEGIL